MWYSRDTIISPKSSTPSSQTTSDPKQTLLWPIIPTPHKKARQKSQLLAASILAIAKERALNQSTLLRTQTMRALSNPKRLVPPCPSSSEKLSRASRAHKGRRFSSPYRGNRYTTAAQHFLEIRKKRPLDISLLRGYLALSLPREKRQYSIFAAPPLQPYLPTHTRACTYTQIPPRCHQTDASAAPLSPAPISAYPRVLRLSLSRACCRLYGQDGLCAVIPARYLRNFRARGEFKFHGERRARRSYAPVSLVLARAREHIRERCLALVKRRRNSGRNFRLGEALAVTAANLFYNERVGGGVREEFWKGLEKKEG